MGRGAPHEIDGETDRDRNARGCSHLDSSATLYHWGDQLRREKKVSDLTVAGLSEGILYDPVYHALKGGHAGSFEVPDHPVGSLQICGCWTFILLAALIQYLSTYWCVFFEGGGRGRLLRNIFLPHRAPTRSSPWLSGWLALWCFDVGVPLRILNRSSSIAGESSVFVLCLCCKLCFFRPVQLFKSNSFKTMTFV